MVEQLTQEDWQRIAEALSHFTHNPEYKNTYDKVKAVIDNEQPLAE